MEFGGDDVIGWSDWIAQPGMLRKLTQIEDEMDECLMSVDADDVASSLRRTCSENVRPVRHTERTPVCIAQFAISLICHIGIILRTV